MAPVYTITEPHPTVPQNSYTHSGRGGAGNFFRAPKTTSPSGVPTPAALTTTTTTTTTTRFYSGRGGAGNAHAAASRAPALSFDEEFTRAEARDKTAHLSHVGRGGAGNVFVNNDGYGDGDSLRRASSGSSAGSAGSSLSGVWSRLRQSVSHRH
ncbi:hypothetical protein VTJ83DRAFT_3578 [Remersonia thermophila]|uniref:Uncharacterized protein n=1 Tax=Remersonia thermophila TaxID=72144 RepID=A0ABR4DEG8_9PEZI